MAIKICLDAGHYGKYNRSPAVPAYYESDMNWKLHLMLKEALEKWGFEVITTRPEQEKDLDLYSRGMTAKGCDLFLSIHSNAVGPEVNEKIDHVSVYRFVDDTTTDLDERSLAAAEKLAPVIAETMQTNTGYSISQRKSSNDRNGDGIMNDNYYGVLNGARQAGCPGLILEHSFHTNTRATLWLLEDANLRTLAKAEAKALAEFYGMEPMPFVDVPENAWYRDAVEWAWRNGITVGRDDTHFDPDTPITRAEAVAMLYRLRNKTGG